MCQSYCNENCTKLGLDWKVKHSSFNINVNELKFRCSRSCSGQGCGEKSQSWRVVKKKNELKDVERKTETKAGRQVRKAKEIEDQKRDERI